jgi:Zn finger protein HypA/HybF involved in hydrogenase expression
LKRCSHFLPLGKCTVRSCLHWDGFKSDSDAGKTQARDAVVKAKLLEPEKLEPGKFRCTTCTKIKDVEKDFYVDPNCKRGHQARCKECDKLRVRMRSSGGGSLADVTRRSA